MERLNFTGSGCTDLSARLWLPDTEPKAVLQITHGMTEHSGRYGRLAEELCAHGTVAACFDLRGHGENPGDPSVASLGEGGWEASLSDMRALYQALTHRFPGRPIFLMGFSLGSFLVREYLSRGGDVPAGAVILGTGHQPGAILSVMAAVVKTQIAKGGFDSSTPLVQKLSFDTYNAKFAPNRTPADWLCADERELDGYRADPLCREHISAGLFWELLCAMKRTGRPDAMSAWKSDMPVLLLSGEDDPVGDFGQGVRRVHRLMENAGLSDVTLQLYPGARHDLLHEEQSGTAARVREMLCCWMDRRL